MPYSKHHSVFEFPDGERVVLGSETEEEPPVGTAHVKIYRGSIQEVRVPAALDPDSLVMLVRACRDRWPGLPIVVPGL